MKIRTYIGSDIKKLIEIWNQAFFHDKIDRKQFITQIILEENFSAEGMLVAEENGEILGFVNCVIRNMPIHAGHNFKKDEGYITAFAVADEEKVKSVGAELLESAEKYLYLHGVKTVTTGYYPTYISQGISKEYTSYVELFLSRGYSFAESMKRELSLSEYIPPDISDKKRRLSSEGYTVSTMKDEYVLSLINPNLPFSCSSWSYEYRVRLKNMDFGTIFIATKDNKIVGCCAFISEDNDGRFGPFGVNRDEQGKGIGTVLLHECLLEMKRRNLKRVWMQWTPVSGSAVSLYDKAGFKATREYLVFSKKIGDINEL